MGRSVNTTESLYSVYCHTTPSGKKYIGISKNPEKRWNNGKGYIKNIFFSRAIEKYGWANIDHTILFSGLSCEEAKELEAKLIDEYKTTEREFGYNIRGGGDGALSEESRKLMSISRMGNQNSLGNVLSNETRKLISESLKKYYETHIGTMSGKHHSAESIMKMKGRTASEETRKLLREHHRDVSGKNNPSCRAIVQFDTNGKIIREYDYASMAAKEHNLDLSSIIRCCKGKQKTCGGYVWKYK